MQSRDLAQNQSLDGASVLTHVVSFWFVLMTEGELPHSLTLDIAREGLLHPGGPCLTGCEHCEQPDLMPCLPHGSMAGCICLQGHPALCGHCSPLLRSALQTMVLAAHQDYPFLYVLVMLYLGSIKPVHDGSSHQLD